MDAPSLLLVLCGATEEFGQAAFQRLRILRQDRHRGMIRTPSDKPGDQSDRGRLEPQTIVSLCDEPGDFGKRQQQAVELDMIAQRGPVRSSFRPRHARFRGDQFGRHTHAQENLREMRPGPPAASQHQAQIEMRARAFAPRQVDQLRRQRQTVRHARQHQHRDTANAAEGYWNGSTPPLGYETYTAEIRGKKHKKKLRIVPAESAIVEHIYGRYLGADGRPSVGIARLAEELNAKGWSYRGRPFTPALVHTILTRETYLGRQYYGVKNSRTGEQRPREEWIEVPVPPIISEKTFERVQNLLKSRDPKMTPARSHSSPVLLSGLGRCGKPDCTGTMMLMTGKGGQYRYYSCSNVRRKKDHSCGGNNVPMDQVDDAVLQVLEKRLLEPTRLEKLLAQLLERSAGADAKRKQQIVTLRNERTGADTAIQRLFEAIEAELIDPKDKDLKKRLAGHQARPAALDEEIKLLERQCGSKKDRIDSGTISAFADHLKKKLTDPNDPALRKNYVQAFVSEVVMTKEQITVRGPVASLVEAVSAPGTDGVPVRTSMVNWRTRLDSNQWPSPSEGDALSS